MKLKNKLAEEFVQNLDLVEVTEFYHKPDITDTNFAPTIQAAYLAGFEKAKELARDCLDDNIGEGGFLIARLGDEEVE
jgi:hypothetical protein